MPTALRTIACMFATALGIVVHHASADTNGPALPVCKPQHEWRTPAPIWTTGLSKDGTLHSAPPEQTGSVIYVGGALDSDAPAFKDPARNGLFDFDVPKGTLRMTKWGRTACATASSTASTPLPRIEIPVWEARRKADGQPRSAPPQRYGELVFMPRRVSFA